MPITTALDALEDKSRGFIPVGVHTFTRSMAKNAKRMTNQAVGIILALVIAGILVGYVLPIGIDAIFAADTSSWGSAETQLFELMPLFFVLVPLVVVVGWAMDAF